MAERRRRKSAAEGRQALIDATLRCLARHGYQGCSTRRIAEEAGVTASLVKHYFSGKAELLRDSYCSHKESELSRFRSAAAAAGPEPQARLDAYLDSLFLAHSEDVRTQMSIWIGFLEPILSDPDFAALQAHYFEEFLKDYKSLLRGFHGPKAPATEALDGQALALNSLIDGLWLEMNLNPARMSANQARAITRDFIKGLLP